MPIMDNPGSIMAKIDNSADTPKIEDTPWEHKNYLLGLYEKALPSTLSLAEKLYETKKAGFDFLELSIDESEEKLARLEWTNRDLWDLRQSQAETKVPIKTICLSGHRRFPLGHPDPQIREKSLWIMERAIILASHIGVRLIQIAGYDVYYERGTEQTKQFFAETLVKSVEIAAAHGVVLAFETMETDFLNTVSKAMYWVSTINSPYLQIYPDIGNITNAAKIYHTNELEDLRSGAGHIAALHLKETLPGIFREVPYMKGHVDFKGAARTAWDLGVRLFTGEFWHLGEQDWSPILKQNQLFLRSVLASVT